ncbi:hypothetical protein CORC01_09757 [Colletotrichum orchidophilum]|uniref:Uncharacterized protein n=1 Tax=Colletotrichum orchidophilum TaxID=1209926 RepID=A0A1G4B0U4_9PEZI|nr:uncharacterized protein CORC01_09757 [Colletotrichum orchidophilum]OHE94963.1 hypothetical protein CORC01_09757 [Colletotrichum orchidophilum]
MYLRAFLLSLFLTTTLALPTAKVNKVFAPTPHETPVQDLGEDTGRIGVDNVDLSNLRVDPVRVIDKISSSPRMMPSPLTKRREVLREEEDGRINIAKEKRSHIQVDPVEVDVHIMRPSIHTMPSTKAAKVEEVQRETAKEEPDNAANAEPKPKYIPKSFRLDFASGGWFRQI